MGSRNIILEALNVRIIGSGEKYLVFAHGFGTDQSAWNRIIPFFSQSYRIILYDLVCAGSVNPDYFDFRRYTTLDAYVDDLLNILDSLAVDRCAYVGHSVSAMIGILASIRRPELFTKLILIGASPRFLNDKDYHGGFEQGEIEDVFRKMQANYEAWVHGFAPLAVGADVPAAVREFSLTLFNMRPDITLFVSRTVFNSDLRGILGLVKVPCCIIQTSRDVSVPASVADYLKTHLGGPNTVETLRTEGHLPHLSAPAQLAQVLRRNLPRETGGFSTMDVYHRPVGLEVEKFWPIEHPMEPQDEDRPVKCPMPTSSSSSSAINDGRIKEDRLRKKAELPAIVNKEGFVVVAAEPPVGTVRKRHHKLTHGDHL